MQIERTSCLWPPSVNGCTRHENIVDDGEDTLAPDPGAIFVLDAAVIHDRGFVKTDTTAMDSPSEGDFIWMEVFPARSSCDITGKIT